MIAPILVILGKTFGPVMAQAILDKLKTTKGANSKFQRVLDAVENGVSVYAALRGEFGDDFLKALSNVVGKNNGHVWTYEAGSADYIELSLDGGEQEALGVLRDELNINLDRLTIISKDPDDALLNYFRGVISKWRSRYIYKFGADEKTVEIFTSMDDLLSGTNLTFKDALEKISKTSLGGVGALMVLSGVLLATGTGVGLATSISMFLFGIPWLSVGALVIPGAILIGLSRYKFSKKHAMSACVKVAYKMLEDRLQKVSLI